MDSSVSAPAGFEHRVAQVVGRPWFWLVLVLSIMTIPAVRAVRASFALPPPSPVLGVVPPFALTDQFGQTFDSDKLQGRVWVANFVFTRCPTVCPKLTQKMGELQHRGRQLGESLHLISFTVDPEHDTPRVLKTYAEGHKVSPRIWSFLTGSREALQKTVVDGLKIYMAKEGPADDLMSYAHGGHFVVVDGKMQLRGFYDSNDPEAVNHILRDVGLLLNRGD
ncbi:MAG: SCO family protein [Myxococcaceae bacterium]